MTMVVGVFVNLVNAQHAVQDLMASGYARDRISVLVRPPMRECNVEEDSQQGPLARAATARKVLAGGPLASALGPGADGTNGQTVAHTLQVAGLQPAAAHFFADAISNGAVLVAVHCMGTGVRDARDILDMYIDADEPILRGNRSLN